MINLVPGNLNTVARSNKLDKSVIITSNLSGSYLDFIGVDTVTAATAITVTLIANPTIGFGQKIADISGSANTYNITINGNGKLIAGTSTVVIASSFGSLTLVFNGSSWSIF